MNQVPFFDLGALARSEKEELHACLERVVEGGYFVGGPVVEAFENEFAKYLGVGYVVGVGNGLDAIRIALEARGIGEGDEVIVPAFTYYATWLAVAQTGATPVPVEVEHLTANIDHALVSSAITDRTRALVTVNLFGQAAHLGELRAISDDHEIVMIEDCAQSHGARHNGSMSGTVGDAGAFSFYPTKNLGALGDAGAIATDDPELAERARSRRSYGQGASKYDHIDTGWNSRLDPLQAAFLSLHLSKLEAWTTRRRHIARRYRDALSDAPASTVVGPENVSESVWHHFVLRTRQRNDVQQYLRSAGVNSDIHYPYSFGEVEPMKRFLAVGTGANDFPVARSLGQQVLSMPMGPWMTDEQVDAVCKALSEVPRELLAQ